VSTAKTTTSNEHKEIHHRTSNEKTYPTSTSAQCPSSRPGRDLTTQQRQQQQVQSRTGIAAAAVTITIGTAGIEISKALL
jgi:hypothetical protein